MWCILSTFLNLQVAVLNELFKRGWVSKELVCALQCVTIACPYLITVAVLLLLSFLIVTLLHLEPRDRFTYVVVPAVKE